LIGKRPIERLNLEERQTTIFLLHAKNTFDHRSNEVKEKLGKELLKLKEEQ
jgi:hypothetical protein